VKATVQIKGIQVEIELTSEQIALVDAQKEHKNFEWQYKEQSKFLVTTVSVVPDYTATNKDFTEHGRYRLTKEIAEKSLLRNKRANRLEALADQLNGLNGPIAYHIARVHDVWTHIHNGARYIPEVVYMSEECAIEICGMLNKGEFSLDGEIQ